MQGRAPVRNFVPFFGKHRDKHSMAYSINVLKVPILTWRSTTDDWCATQY